MEKQKKEKDLVDKKNRTDISYNRLKFYKQKQRDEFLDLLKNKKKYN